MEKIIAEFLMRGTGMDGEIALVRASHLLNDLDRAGYKIVGKSAHITWDENGKRIVTYPNN